MAPAGPAGPAGPVGPGTVPESAYPTKFHRVQSGSRTSFAEIALELLSCRFEATSSHPRKDFELFQTKLESWL